VSLTETKHSRRKAKARKAAAQQQATTTIVKKSNPQKSWLHRPTMNAPVPKREHEREQPSAVAERLGMPRLLSRKDVCALSGLTYVSIWKRMQTEPPSFPRSRIEGGRSVWISSQVLSWLENLPLRKLKSDKAKQTEPASAKRPRS
jgi:predicted DNA-binding transcriptional regulator AlpA